MPPEQFPWDRRDFRKHDRSGSDQRFTSGGEFGGSGQHRWREQHHHPHAPPHPPLYHHHYNQPQQQRWYSDFRSSRPIPPGHGKQGGWHMYTEESGHGFPPFGSRYSDRNVEDDNFRPFGSRSDGRYFRNSRESRGSFGQKDFRSPSWEPSVAWPSGPGRPNTGVNKHKSIENTPTCHNSGSKGNNNSENTQACHNNNSKGNNSENTQTCHKNSSKGNNFPLPLPDSLVDQSQAVVKEKSEKDGVTADEPTSSGQKSDKENVLGPTDWKLNWNRSESISSRGSGFSRSSSSRSMGVNSIENLTEVQQKKATPVNFPAAAVCVELTAPAPSDDTSSRKKPRLGWGEGLAKYEKKKVEGPEDSESKDVLIDGVTTTESMHLPSVNPLDRSPKVVDVLLDCASPATPSSVACSSSPGIEEKESIKAVNIDHDSPNLICSPCIMSQTHREEPILNLENVDLASIASLSSLINETLQSDPSYAETGYVRTTSMNKLLVWKVDILKALEVTESEIDSLETELKSLISEPRSGCPHPDAFRLLPEECHSNPCEQVTASSTVRPAPLQVVASGNMIVENMPAVNQTEYGALKDEDIDSPGSATSKLVEALPSGENPCPSKTPECVEGFPDEGSDDSSYLESSEDGLIDEDNDVQFNVDHHAYDAILASNKDSANSALEELNKLLPAQQCPFDVLSAAKVFSLQTDSRVIKERFLMRKRSLLLKEKIITLKFKVFQHFWRQGRIVSVSKLRGKSHKKLDLCRSGYKKNRSSSRSRLSYSAGSSRKVPAEEIIEFINGLLAESPIRPCRSTLKMPALILDKQMKMSRFISNNALVEDPCAAEKERSMINPWTAEETEMFIDKLAIFGKDFSKIAIFLEHKTIADCIEFYYKNHKSECFERARSGVSKQTKSQSTTYLVADGKRWNHGANAASLGIRGEASVIASNVNNDVTETQKRCGSTIYLGAPSSQKAARDNYVQLERSNSLDDNEAVAADVLAGICGSISSEAMSSCITSSVDPTGGYQEWKCQRVSSCVKRPLTQDVRQHADDECSDESCGEMNSTDWTDEEKSFFVQAVSSYGKDFAMISECLRTRSVEQCKIFFSKARKCLGLDGVTPGAGNGAVCGDGNGGGSDNEGASAPVVCNDDSECKMEVDVPNHESYIAGASDLKPDFEICEENSRPCSLDSVAAEPVSKNPSMDFTVVNDNSMCDTLVDDNSMGDTMVDDKRVMNFNVDSNEQCDGANGESTSKLDVKNSVLSTDVENVQVEDGNGHGGPNGSSDADDKALAEVSDGHNREENEGQGLILLEDNSENKKVNGGGGGANSTEMSVVSCASIEMKAGDVVSHPCGDSLFPKLSDSGSGDLPLQQNVRFASMESPQMFSVPIKYPRHSSTDALSDVSSNGIIEEHSQKVARIFPDSVETSQILRGYPVSVQTVKEMNGDFHCVKHVRLTNVLKRDGRLNSDRQLSFSLRKCTTGLRNQSEDVPFPSKSGCSPDVDKMPPPRNGDVKLFGKILISSQEKGNSRDHRDDNNNGQHHNEAGHHRQSLNLKLSGGEKVNLDSFQSKVDCNDHLGSENNNNNIPFKSLGFRDESRTTQAPIFPLKDSTFLLAKYPAAFSNHSTPTPTVKLDQTSLNSTLFNDIAEYQLLRNRELQPPQDVLFSEMQRRNGFSLLQGMPHQPMVGIDVGRGVLVGGQRSGVSNPVTAIKLHYAKAQSMKAGNIVREDDT